MAQNKVKCLLASIIFLSVIFLVGCWNYRELNTLSIVAGIAIDKHPRGGYLITVEIINPRLEGNETLLTPVILSMEGNSIFEAVRNLVMRSGRRLYSSHTKVVIISQELAIEGIEPLLDWIHRDTEIRGDVWLLISHENTAADILRGNSPINKAVSFHLDDVSKSQKTQTKYPVVELWNFLQKLSGEGISPIVPLTNLVEIDGKKIPQIYGTAVFQRDKLIGKLDGLSTQMFVWLTKPELNDLLFVEKSKGSGLVITYEIFHQVVKMQPIEKAGELIIDIQLKLKMGIAEINRPNLNYMNPEVKEDLEKEANKYIKAQIEKMISITQKEFQSDILGFGKLIKERWPKKWKKINEEWRVRFPELKVHITVDTEIKSSAMTTTPIQMRD